MTTFLIIIALLVLLPFTLNTMVNVIWVIVFTLTKVSSVIMLPVLIVFKYNVSVSSSIRVMYVTVALVGALLGSLVLISMI
jgi:hypothetical protein